MKFWKLSLFALLMVLVGLAVFMACDSDDDDDDDDKDTDDDDAADDDTSDDDAADDDSADDDSSDDDTADDDDDDEFTLGSTAFDDGGTIPDEYTCKTKTSYGISPPLSWTNLPAGTVAVAITVFDKSAPLKDTSYFGHWGITNIPPTVLSLDAGISPGGTLPSGAWEVMNDFMLEGYGGPCPPVSDAPHEYEFTVWALSQEIPQTKGPLCPNSLKTQLMLYAIAYVAFSGYFGF